jgi:hypothetical protein
MPRIVAFVLCHLKSKRRNEKKDKVTSYGSEIYCVK